MVTLDQQTVNAIPSGQMCAIARGSHDPIFVNHPVNMLVLLVLGRLA